MAPLPLRRNLRALLATLGTVVGASGCLASTALAVDRIYWGNYNGNKISFAALNDAGGADLTITGTTVSQPQGVAIDAAAGKIYWAQYSPSKIRVANLNGTGGGDLPTGTATVNNPAGLAIDPAGGRAYWSNNGSKGSPTPTWMGAAAPTSRLPVQRSERRTVSPSTTPPGRSTGPISSPRARSPGPGSTAAAAAISRSRGRRR